jgi:hypothetical protein
VRTKKGGKPPKPHDMPFQSVKAMVEALPDIFVTVIRPVNGPITEYYDRETVSRITGKAIPTLEMWRAKGWLVPARKHGNMTLYDLEEIHALIETGEFPSQQDREETA